MPDTPDPPVPQLARYVPELFAFLHEHLLTHWEASAFHAQYTLETWRSVDAERLSAEGLAAMLESHRRELATHNRSNDALARMLGRLLVSDWREREAIAAWWDERAVTD